MRRTAGFTLLEVLAVAAVLIILFLLGSVFVPIRAGDNYRAPNACLSNLKQMAIGIAMYASDADDRLPLAKDWMDGLDPYVKNPNVSQCYAVKPGGHGYAMNRFLAGVSEETLEKPTEMHLVYDASSLGKSITEYLPSFPLPARHGGNNNVAFADTHARAVPMGPK
ncbi:MAG: type II secretion system protein [Fimbriimonas sp.]